MNTQSMQRFPLLTSGLPLPLPLNPPKTNVKFETSVYVIKSENLCNCGFILLFFPKNQNPQQFHTERKKKKKKVISEKGEERKKKRVNKNTSIPVSV